MNQLVDQSNKNLNVKQPHIYAKTVKDRDRRAWKGESAIWLHVSTQVAYEQGAGTWYEHAVCLHLARRQWRTGQLSQTHDQILLTLSTSLNKTVFLEYISLQNRKFPCEEAFLYWNWTIYRRATNAIFHYNTKNLQNINLC